MSYKVEIYPEGVTLPKEVVEYLGETDDYSELWATCMVVTYNKEILYFFIDGEPEDMSLDRALSWLPSALEEAYNLGVKDGKNS
jgi:hypothetical protein